MDAAGGPIARKRLEAELRGLRESQKLPWVEVDGRRASPWSPTPSRCTSASTPSRLPSSPDGARTS